MIRHDGACPPGQVCLDCLHLARMQRQSWAYEHGFHGAHPMRSELWDRGIEYDHANALIEFESRKRHGLIK